MNKIINLLLAGVLAIMISACNSGQKPEEQEVADISSGPRKVELKKNDKGYYRLFVDDEEFYIWGAGLEFGDKKLLASHGANSFRNWSTDNGRETGQEVLDEALENGLMVFMGLDIKRERHGFDYDDPEQVQQQKEDIRKQIMAYKDHPALLGWGVGNELNLHYTNKKVWDAVNDISTMIREIDPDRLTTTSLAGMDRETVELVDVDDYLVLVAAEILHKDISVFFAPFPYNKFPVRRRRTLRGDNTGMGIYR